MTSEHDGMKRVAAVMAVAEMRSGIADFVSPA